MAFISPCWLLVTEAQAIWEPLQGAHTHAVRIQGHTHLPLHVPAYSSSIQNVYGPSAVSGNPLTTATLSQVLYGIDNCRLVTRSTASIVQLSWPFPITTGLQNYLGRKKLSVHITQHLPANEFHNQHSSSSPLATC